MTTYSSERYLVNKVKYRRPSAIMFAENPGTLVGATDKSGNPVYYKNADGTTSGTQVLTYVPVGYDIYANQSDNNDSSLSNQFLILSDHNRKALDFKQNRIEKRERMINGRMRSFWTADKVGISTSWDNLPSRAYSGPPLFDPLTGAPSQTVDGNTFFQFTVDGGAGGNELLSWYENHKGSFWVYLSYDKYTDFDGGVASYQHLNQYNQVIEMFISDFSYAVEKRGGTNYDMWNISLSLEEA
ncbi:hypothetical protein UFOVP222_44 [uncultured Caudovirales phage]|uniref:Uncharacterized protein n=1 Tax=uncultured Caudovirales phage TaxID=2100421 RepID=A0A6J5TBF3_9CAUD|nr:hypothetical protein UFOVP108_39 [uncultured Caudovirales phage]CAB5219237.1 hypothetical protein UFOVP222_44 [uncultured Caudovirales phage]